MPGCVVKGCVNYDRKYNKKNDNISYHRFPTDSVRNEAWSRVIRQERGEPYFKPNKYLRICSAHFKADDFYISGSRRMLKKTAIPSVNNQGSNGKIFCPKCNTEVPHTAEGIHEDQTKILVAKVYHYFEQEYEQLKTIYGDLDLTPLSKFRQRTALATGVSETTVLQILKEEEDRNSDKRQEPTETRRRARKRSHTDSSSDEDSSDDNVDDGGQSSFVQLAQDKPEIETLVVKLESPEHYKEQTQPGPLLAEVKSEPPNDDENNTEETLALNEPAGTKRKATKIPRSDVTPTLQHTQGESSTTAAASSARLAEGLHESVRLGEREVKVENVETLVEEGFS